MIRRLIRTIRQKPKAMRNNVAFATACTFTGLVACIWVYNLPAKFSDMSFSGSDTTKESSVSGFFDGLRTQTAAIGDAFSGSASSTQEAPTFDQPAEVSATTSFVSDFNRQITATSTAAAGSSSASEVTTPQPAAATSTNREVRLQPIKRTPTSSTEPTS